MTEALVAFLGVLGLLIVVILYSTLSWSFVTYKFYGWFLLSAIEGLPNLQYLSFIGINLFLMALFSKKATPDIDEKFLKPNSKKETKVFNFILPWILLAIGYVFKITLF
jgi:hypothetical protein